MATRPVTSYRVPENLGPDRLAVSTWLNSSLGFFSACPAPEFAGITVYDAQAGTTILVDGSLQCTGRPWDYESEIMYVVGLVDGYGGVTLAIQDATVPGYTFGVITRTLTTINRSLILATSIPLSSLEAQITEAQSTADSAEAAAVSAQSTADAASSAATAASSAASSAQSTADSASSAAAAAASSAAAAQSTADSAATTASSASSAASAAQTTADSALVKSNDALDQLVIKQTFDLNDLGYTEQSGQYYTGIAGGRYVWAPTILGAPVQLTNAGLPIIANLRVDEPVIGIVTGVDLAAGLLTVNLSTNSAILPGATAVPPFSKNIAYVVDGSWASEAPVPSYPALSEMFSETLSVPGPGVTYYAHAFGCAVNSDDDVVLTVGGFANGLVTSQTGA